MKLSSTLRIWFFALLLAAVPAGAFAQAAGTQPSGITGTSLTALMVENQKSVNDAIAARAGATGRQPGQNPITYYYDLYKLTGGGPVLYWLNVPLNRITNNAAFKAVYWLVILFGGAICSLQALNSLRGGGTEYLDRLASFLLKLMAGTLIVANPGMVYALTMTLRDSFNLVVEQAVSGSSTAAQALQNTIGNRSLYSQQLDAIKANNLDQAIKDRYGVFLDPKTTTVDRKEMGRAMNAIATAVNTLKGGPVVTLVSDSDMSAPNASTHRQLMTMQLRQTFMALASLGGPQLKQFSVEYPQGSTQTFDILGWAISDPDKAPQKTRVRIESMVSTPDNLITQQQLTDQYGREVYLRSRDNIDMVIGGVFSKSPIKGWADGFVETLSSAFEYAAAATTGWIEATMKFIVGAVNNLLAAILTPVITILLDLMLELNVFLMIMIMPLWLLPVTPKAFPAIFRTLFNCTLFMPAFQLLMIVTDAIFGKVLQWASTGAFGAVAVAPVAGPLPALGIALGYIVAYIVTVIVLLKNTPKIVNAAFSGAGAVSTFLGTQAKGLAAGALAAAGVAAAPAVGASIGAFGTKAAAGSSALAKSAAARMPVGLRSAARAAGYRARQAYSAVPQPVRSGISRSSAAVRRSASSGFYKSLLPPKPTTSPSGGADKPEKPHQSFTNPYVYAMKRSAQAVHEGVKN